MGGDDCSETSALSEFELKSHTASTHSKASLMRASGSDGEAFSQRNDTNSSSY